MVYLSYSSRLSFLLEGGGDGGGGVGGIIYTLCKLKRPSYPLDVDAIFFLLNV